MPTVPASVLQGPFDSYFGVCHAIDSYFREQSEEENE